MVALSLLPLEVVHVRVSLLLFLVQQRELLLRQEIELRQMLTAFALHRVAPTDLLELLVADVDFASSLDLLLDLLLLLLALLSGHPRDVILVRIHL